jgi:hypothetical protein
MRPKSRKCPFFLCEQTVKGSKQDNSDKPGKDQRVLFLDISQLVSNRQPSLGRRPTHTTRTRRAIASTAVRPAIYSTALRATKGKPAACLVVCKYARILIPLTYLAMAMDIE